MAAYSNNLRELKILFAGIAIFGIKIDTHKNMGIFMLSRFMQRKTMIKMTIQTHQGNNRECFRDVGSFWQRRKPELLAIRAMAASASST